MEFNWEKRNRYESTATYNGLRIAVYITHSGFWYYSYYSLEAFKEGNGTLDSVNNMKQAKAETEKRIKEIIGWRAEGIKI